jgi:hypothetical protein
MYKTNDTRGTYNNTALAYYNYNGITLIKNSSQALY